MFAIKSQFGQQLGSLRANVCQPQNFSCGEWEKYKADFETSLISLDGYKTEVPEFQRCLKRRETINNLNADDFAPFARHLHNDRTSDPASAAE